MFLYRNCLCLIVLVSLVLGCGDSPTSQTSAGPGPGQGAESTGNTQETAGADSQTVESVVLRKELHEVWVDIGVEDEGRSEAEAKEGLDEFVGKLIDSVRKNDPDFLMVSPEVEAKLQNGEAIEDSEERIKSLTDSFTPQAHFANHLLKKYNAGGLTPVRTELLAHVLAADKAGQAKKKDE